MKDKTRILLLRFSKLMSDLKLKHGYFLDSIRITNTIVFCKETNPEKIYNLKNFHLKNKIGLRVTVSRNFIRPVGSKTSRSATKKTI